MENSSKAINSLLFLQISQRNAENQISLVIQEEEKKKTKPNTKPISKQIDTYNLLSLHSVLLFIMTERYA